MEAYFFVSLGSLRKVPDLLSQMVVAMENKLRFRMLAF